MIVLVHYGFIYMYTVHFAYFVYGFTFSFISLSIQFELVNVYKYSPSDLAFAWSCVSAPWALKPVWGFFSDRIGRRLSVCLGMFSSGMLLAYMPNMGSSLVIGLCITSFCLCFSDVATDSIVVEHTKKDGGALQSQCWLWRSFGSLIAVGLSGSAYTYIKYAGVVRVACVSPLVMSLLIWNISEPERHIAPVLTSIKSLYGMQRLVLIAVFFGLVPEVENVYFYFLKDQLLPVQMSITSVIGSCAACIVSFLYQYLGGFVCPLKIAVILGMISNAIAFATYLGAPVFQMEIARSVVGGCSGMLVVLPLVVHAAKKSTDGGEGVSYALFVAIMNLSGVIGEMLEGVFVNYINRDMGLFLACCTIVSFIPWTVIDSHEA